VLVVHLQGEGEAAQGHVTEGEVLPDVVLSVLAENVIVPVKGVLLEVVEK